MRCALCGDSFRERRTLENHLAATHFAQRLTDDFGLRDLPARHCPTCDAAVAGRSVLWHLAYEHGVIHNYVRGGEGIGDGNDEAKAAEEMGLDEINERLRSVDWRKMEADEAEGRESNVVVSASPVISNITLPS